jgi:hypothetical protein
MFTFIAGIIAAMIGGTSAVTPIATPTAPAATSTEARTARVLGTDASLPVAFVENRGQLDPRVRYYARSDRYAFYLTRDEVMLAFVGPSTETNTTTTNGHALALRFPGSNPHRSLGGEQRVAGDVNYFRGADASAWRTAIPRYAR